MGLRKDQQFFFLGKDIDGEGGGKRYILRELISGLEVRTRKEYRLILIDQVHT